MKEIGIISTIIFIALGILNTRCCVRIFLARTRIADYLVKCLVFCLALADVLSTAISLPKFVSIYRTGKWENIKVSCCKENLSHLMYTVASYLVLITLMTLNSSSKKRINEGAEKDSKQFLLSKTVISIALSFSCLLLSSKYSLIYSSVQCDVSLESKVTAYDLQEHTDRNNFLIQVVILMLGFVFILAMAKLGTAQKKAAKMEQTKEITHENDKILFVLMMLVFLFSLALVSNMILQKVLTRMTPFLSSVSAILPLIVTSSIPSLYSVAVDSFLGDDCMHSSSTKQNVFVSV